MTAPRAAHLDIHVVKAVKHSFQEADQENCKSRFHFKDISMRQNQLGALSKKQLMGSARLLAFASGTCLGAEGSYALFQDAAQRHCGSRFRFSAYRKVEHKLRALSKKQLGNTAGLAFTSGMYRLTDGSHAYFPKSNSTTRLVSLSLLKQIDEIKAIMLVFDLNWTAQVFSGGPHNDMPRANFV